MAIIQNPQFKTAKGVIFDLEPIPPLIASRFDIEYNKNNPPPEPPFREVKIVGVPTKQRDTEDAYYKQEVELWNSRKRDAEMVFMFSRGIKNKVPKDWQYDPETAPEKPKDSMIKALWVYEQIGHEDMEALQEAIMSLNGVTQQAIEEAEKNLTPVSTE